MELSWSRASPLEEEEPEEANNSHTVTFAVSFFDRNGFPQDEVLYDFIVRNASSSSSSSNGNVMQRFASQNAGVEPVRHNVTFDTAAETTIQVDVVIRSIGPSPVLLHDEATFEIAVVPEFSSLFMMTTIVSFFVGTIVIVTRAKLPFPGRG